MNPIAHCRNSDSDGELVKYRRKRKRVKSYSLFISALSSSCLQKHRVFQFQLILTILIVISANLLFAVHGAADAAADATSDAASSLDAEISSLKSKMKNLTKKSKEDEENRRIKCSVCRKLVDKFMEGLEKTKKSGYGGGNTAWEEQSLGRNTFAFSETRFVEIMEKVCENVSGERETFYCGNLVEEHEDTIEEWFQAKKIHELENLLCIETLAFCCPYNTYGPDCTACPNVSAAVYCNGQGECGGNGTRSGTGECSCTSPYNGSLCRECNFDHFVDHSLSNDSHVVCTICNETCGSEGCVGPNGTQCNNCANGFVMSQFEDGRPNECLDVDECLDASACDERTEYCVNTVGDKDCIKCDEVCHPRKGCAGYGPGNCTACRRGADWDADRRNCVVVDWKAYDDDLARNDDDRTDDDEDGGQKSDDGGDDEENDDDDSEKDFDDSDEGDEKDVSDDNEKDEL